MWLYDKLLEIGNPDALWCIENFHLQPLFWIAYAIEGIIIGFIFYKNRKPKHNETSVDKTKKV